MASTTAGAVKAFIETLGLSVPCFRDEAPVNKSDGTPQSRPYVVIQDSLGDFPLRTGDNKYKRTTELVQVDVYENIINPTTGARDESYSLAKTIFRSLTSTRLTTAPERVWQLREFGRLRSRNAEINEIRTTITLSVVRDL